MRFRAIGAATAADLELATAILRKRVDKLGAAGVEVSRRGRLISVRFPHRIPPLAKVLGKRGLLEFYDFEADLVGPLVSGSNRTPVAKASLRGLLNGTKRAPRNTIVVTCDNRAGECLTPVPANARTGFFLFKHIKGKVPELTGKDLQQSTVRADLDPATNLPVVVFQLTDRGKRIFRAITRREAERGRIVGGNCRVTPPPAAQHFAIVLDREIQSAPYIDYCKNPDGIPADNGVEIDLGAGGTLDEAKRLAFVLQTGALPVRLVRIR